MQIHEINFLKSYALTSGFSRLESNKNTSKFLCYMYWKLLNIHRVYYLYFWNIEKDDEGEVLCFGSFWLSFLGKFTWNEHFNLKSLKIFYFIIFYWGMLA